MLSLYEILKASKTGIAPDMWTALAGANFGGAGSGAEVKELTGIPPLSFTSNGQPLLDYTIYGNTVQSVTPSPDNPIMPQGTGERAGNLSQWEKGGISTTTGADEAYRTAEQGGTCEQLRSLYIPCYGNANYVLHTNHYPVQSFISYYDADKNYISRSSGISQGENRGFTTPEMARYMRAQLAHVTTDQVYPAIEENQQYAITFGSTALPYEPYGYKLTISSTNTTTPVYLGEVETTRKVKKLVLTGEETIPNNDGASYNSETSTDRFVRDIPLSVGDNGTSKIILCTHLGFQAQSWSARTKTGCCIYCSKNTIQLHLRFNNTTLGITQSDTNEQRTEKLKSYLAQQYAAGTPVTVWYVLANEETGIVNEPLMKIGDYADSVSMEQAGVSIPTLNKPNNTVIDVDTALKPSEMYIKYNG